MKDRGSSSVRHLHSSVYPVTPEDLGPSHAMSTDVSDWGRTLTLDTDSGPKTRQEQVIKHHWENICQKYSLRWELNTFLAIHWHLGMIRAPRCIRGSQVDLFNPLVEIERAVAFLSYTQSRFRLLWFDNVWQIPAVGTEIFWGLKWDKAVVNGKFQVQQICEICRRLSQKKRFWICKNNPCMWKLPDHGMSWNTGRYLIFITESILLQCFNCPINFHC